jgi:hypothetical protein
MFNYQHVRPVCDTVWKWLVVVFSGYSGFTTNKTDCHDITETLLKVALKQHKPRPVWSYPSLLVRSFHLVPLFPCW